MISGARQRLDAFTSVDAVVHGSPGAAIPFSDKVEAVSVSKLVSSTGIERTAAVDEQGKNGVVGGGQPAAQG